MIELDSDIKEKMASLRQAMAQAADGKILKRELAKRLRGIMNPLVTQQRNRVLGIPSKGHAGPSMRQAIARQTKAATRWSGKSMGVSVIQRARSMPRDFAMAGRMFNREEGWHPKSLGGEVLHQQVRPTQWFDQGTADRRQDAGRQVLAALEETAAKIGRTAKQ